MKTVDSHPFIDWLILVYDRTAAERFPFKRRWYYFNYDRATDAETREVLRLCDHKPPTDVVSKKKLAVGETRVSFQLGGGSVTSKEILHYRHLFDYVPDERELPALARQASGMLPVMLAPNTYFEDENEHPISLMEIFDEEAKREHGPEGFAILHDHPDSILRCGPAEPVRAELWSHVDAGLIAQLFQVYAQLVRSRWLRGPCKVTAIDKNTYKADLPVGEDCRAVILPFRQLYSKDSADDLFNRCCKLHSRHCPQEHPTFGWVNSYKTSFNKFLDCPASFPLNDINLSAKRYLDAFAYGSGSIHASNKNNEHVADLRSLLTDHPKEMVVMGYHYILRTLLGHVSMAISVLRQNIVHWIRDLGWEGCATPLADELFGV